MHVTDYTPLELLITVSTQVTVLRDLTPCSLGNNYQSFGKNELLGAHGPYFPEDRDNSYFYQTALRHIRRRDSDNFIALSSSVS